MAGEQINGQVGVNVSAKGMEGAVSKLGTELDKLVLKIENAGRASADQLKQLAIQTKQMQSLIGASGMGRSESAQNIGKRARAYNEFSRNIDKSSNSMQTLRSRVQAANVEIGKLVQSGKKPEEVQFLNASNLERSATAYSKVTNQVNGLRGRIAVLGSESRKALAPMVENLERLDRQNSKSFKNKSATDFTSQTDALRRQANLLRDQVTVREKLEAKARLNIQALREEGQQILNNTRMQREALLADSARKGERGLKNRELIGAEDPYRRMAGSQRRLEQQTRSLAAAKRMLNVELGKPVELQNAARIDQLIGRHNILQREIGETIALRNREARSESARPKGAKGFMAGIKEGRGNAFGGESGTFGAGALIGRVASYAVAAGAIYGLITAVTQGVRTVIEFEDALAQLQAVSGATGLELTRLSQNILTVSQNSATSVLELTKSATIIAQAGYAGSEIPDMLESVVNLADASGSTTDEAVDILTSALGSFQLAASESARVTDVLVNTLNRSKLSVNQVQLGLQYVGAAAKQNNISLEELTATLGTMADAGIRSGSTMSTGLRQMLVDFIDPSKKLVENLEKVGLTTADIDVKTLGLVEVLGRLRENGFQAYGSLETRAAAAYQVLATNIDGINELKEAALVTGTAERAQQERLGSLSAQWQQLMNYVTAFGAEVGSKLLPVLKELVGGLIGVAEIIQDVNTYITATNNTMDRFFASISSSPLIDLSNNARTASEKFRELNEVSDKYGLTIEENNTLTSAMRDGLEGLETASNDTSAEISTLEARLASLESEAIRLVSRQEDLVGKTREVGIEVDTLSGRFPGLRDEFEKTKGGIGGLISALVSLDAKLRQTLQNKINFQMATLDLKKSAVSDVVAETGSSLSGGFSREQNWYSRDLLGNSPYQNPEFRRAFELAQSNNPSTRSKGINLWNNLPQEVRRNAGQTAQDYFYNRANEAVLDDQITRLREDSQANQYLSGNVGQSFTEAGIRSQGLATRAASQGSAGGMSREQIGNNIQADLDRLDRNLKLDLSDGVRKAIEDQRAVLQGALGTLNNVAKEDAKKETKKGSRAANRAKRDRERILTRIAKEQQEYQKQLYDNMLDSMKNAPTLEQLPDTMDALGQQLNAWLEGEYDLTMQEIEALNPSEEQRAALAATARRNLQAKREEEVKKMADTFATLLDTFIKESMEDVNRAFEEATRPTDRANAIAQARSEGLNRSVGSENTPDYFKVVTQRRAEEASVASDRATMIANDDKISKLIELAEDVRARKEEIQFELDEMIARTTGAELNPGDTIVVTAAMDEARTKLRGIDEQLENIESQTEDLIDVNAALHASYTVLNDVPTTFGDGMKMAIEAVKLDIGAADSLGQELIKNLDQPLKAVHQSFKGFFSDIMSGTVSLGQAFKNMAGTIIDAILEMVAVALANQFFSLIAGIFGPTGQSGLNSEFGNFASTGDLSSLGLWRGGEVPKGYFGGGSIGSGLPTRDSTLINAAQGEYVIRRPAAQSIGKGFLDAMNARGANALKEAGPQMNIMAPQQVAPVNVYVVAPEEKPTMGPNDVLATFSNDVLRGGVTKKLIEQVSRNSG